LESLLFHKKAIQNTFVKQIKDNTAVAVKVITENIKINLILRELEATTHLNNQIKVKNSELNQFNGKTQAIAILQTKNEIHKNGKTFISPPSLVYS
jgi:predicted RNA-binding protein with RPS1 domain